MNTVISPVLRIVPSARVIDLGGIGGVILTSENGARALKGVAAVTGVRAWCVGDQTARVAQELGMRTSSAGGDADALVSMLIEDNPAGTLMHAHGVRTKGDVVVRLRAAGLRVESRIVYEQIPLPLTHAAHSCLHDRFPVILPLFSPRSAELAGKAALTAVAPLTVIALSQAVFEAWEGPAPQQLSIAERPESTNMLESVAVHWTSLTS